MSLMITLNGVVNLQGQKVTTEPTFKVDFTGKSHLYTPTADKPQSKLWFMDSRWWALLHADRGPSLWERTDRGWVEHEEVNRDLQGVSGRADVWYENRTVTAVCVSDQSLTVIRTFPSEPRDSRTNETMWHSKILARLILPVGHNANVETATIVKDASGVWWISANYGRSIYVWASADAKSWSAPILLGEDISDDDISTVSILDGAVTVIWSDQRSEAFYAREHLNGDPYADWSPIKVIDSGNRAADDHINTALSSDGTLWVNTKNEIDKVGFPNLTLHVRTPSGKWRNFPYLTLEQFVGPSRPVVITTPDPAVVLAGYSVYDRTHKKKYEERYDDRIAFGVIDTTATDVLIRKKDVIAPDSSFQSIVNNITGPKVPFPEDGPWIILASDHKGNIYEADLRTLIEGLK